MLVECSQCKKKLRVQEEKIRPGGSKFKCPQCGAILSVNKTASAIMKEEKDKSAREQSFQSVSVQQERRKYPRYPFREEIIIDGSKRCTCSDISELGLYISTIQSFEEKGIIEVTIPFKENFLTVNAQVQYYQPGIGMGIMFIDLTDEQKAIIKEIIEKIKHE
jgi:predicted Zn finger-like uncharacterized protein